MTGSAGDAITGTSDDHFRGLERCVIGGGESSIGRQGGERCISEIAFDKGAQGIKLLPASRVTLYFSFGE